MRPLKLTISAFGPYSEVEVIDFADLQSRNLFLITGPTGSGKTTIFDAISYALYGKASGDLRTEENLRSHFSSPDLLTEVTLVFELNKVQYEVYRTPKQMRPKARTEGFTEQKPDATLTMKQGESTTVIAGVSKVNKQIETILGINEEQFKQIMMIPQGEFRKLLISDSQEREKVLQQLFDTYDYRKVQMDLNEKAKILGGAIKREKVARDTLITQIKPGDDLVLVSLIEAEDKFVDKINEQTQELISGDKTKEKALLKSIGEMDEAIKGVLKAQNKANEDNNNLLLKIETEEAIKVQEARQPTMDEMQLLVVKGEKAARLVGAEQNIISRELEIRKREAEQEASVALISELSKMRDTAEQALKALKSEEAEEENNKRRLQLAEYERFVPKVSGLQHLEANVIEKTHSLELLNQAIEHHKNQKIKAEKQIENFNEKLHVLRDVPVKLERLKGEQKKVEQHQKQLLKTLELLKTLKAEASLLTATKQEVKSEAARVEVAQKNYKEAQLTFLLNQAAIISKELKVNEPCPVCGSTEHPSPAKVTLEMVTKEEVELLEVGVNKAKAKYDEVLKQLAIQNERYANYIKGLKDLIDELFEEGDTLFNKPLADQLIEVGAAKDEVGRQLKVMMRDLQVLLEQNNSIEVIKERLAKGVTYMVTIETDLKKQNEVYMTSIETLTKLKSDLDHVYEQIPEELRRLEVLEANINKCKAAIQTYEKHRLKARKDYDEVNDRCTKEAAKNQQLIRFIEEEKVAVTQLWRTFNEQVLASGFTDMASYKASKVDEDELRSLQQSVKDYNLQLDRLKESLKLYRQKTSGISHREMGEFELHLKELQLKRQMALEEQGEIKARIRDNCDVLASVSKINDLIKDKEATYNVVGKLARIAQGNNPSMMTFERYVLAAFLEDILLAANIRLKQMTQGRYVLSRTSALQRKNKQSGLELEVFDNFTGKSRHVKTLSGGEGFKASLSMALGLSDVVQSYAGGVRLDTMFIDEGFGTLDQESLDSAIDCLIDLQKNGRLVGIISHVQELKERIDTRLEIRSSNTGSETRFVLG